MKRAFTLIEISVTILIIGILIAGITNSSRIVLHSRLTSARNITQASTVPSIRSLELWLEPTYKSSFLEYQQEDGGFITKWNNLNPQATFKNNLTRNTAGDAKITYKRDGINGIPAVYFNGDTASTDYLSGTAIATPANEYSLFLVIRLDDNTPTTVIEDRYAFVNGNSASSGLSY